VLRIAVGTAGALLGVSGLRRGSDLLGSAAALAGAATLYRAASNRPFAALVGAWPSARTIEITKVVTVRAPVAEVFRFFTDFENFPKFMLHVREVRRLDGSRWHWKVQGPAGIPFEWDGVITRLVDSEAVAWTSTEGALVRHRGDALFESLPDGSTRLSIHLVYEPPLGDIGHAVSKLFGADPKHELDDDLIRFKSLLERGRATGRYGVVTRAQLGGSKPS